MQTRRVPVHFFKKRFWCVGNRHLTSQLAHLTVAHPLLAIGAPVRVRPVWQGAATNGTSPLRVHVPARLAPRGVTVYPRQAAERPPH